MIKLINALKYNKDKKMNDEFVEWCQYYREDLVNMYEIVCFKLKSRKLTLNQFCNWVWKNSNNQLKIMNDNKKYDEENRK
jgi:hypothetical protein